MEAPPYPRNEVERLSTLRSYSVLDTEEEAAFDRIVHMAQSICHTPITLVSLVDDHRQWFKARIGLVASETPRDISFCGHVVFGAETLVIENTLEDARFRDNPLVVGYPHIRFYAGAPLRAPSGHILGTLCAIDHRPRQLSSEKRMQLEDLAHVTMTQLNLQRQISMREKAEQDSRNANAFLETARKTQRNFFEVSLDLLCIAGFDGYFKELNPAWTDTLGWSLKELYSRPFIDFVHAEDRETTVREAQKLARTREYKAVKFVNRYRTREGDYRWLMWSGTQNPDGTAIIAAARDITTLKAQEARLTAECDAAEEANLAKSTFLANMSHELRTPLNSVLGFTSLLLRNAGQRFLDRDLDLLERVHKNGQHLLSMIDEILDLSKVEAGQTTLEKGPVALSELIEEIQDELAERFTAAENTLRISVPTNLLPIEADARRLKQIIVNLVVNANKFTKRGAIEIRVCATDSTPVRIDVVDTGIGIPKMKQQQIFGAFRQASEGTSRRYGGSGLGLAISRTLSELHGFELGVVSREHEGSTFYLKLAPGVRTPTHRSSSESAPSDIQSMGSTPDST
ncbi:MAG: ATP-binding protein [Myxococcota bacterium]